MLKQWKIMSERVSVGYQNSISKAREQLRYLFEEFSKKN